MARKSHAAQARLANLQKSCKVTVEDSTDSDEEDSEYLPKPCARRPLSDSTFVKVEPELRDFFLVLDDEGLACESSDSDLDSDSDSGFDSDEDAEIRDDASLLNFSETLKRAQELAVAAERKKWEEKKRPRHYTGSSERTLHHFAAKRRKIAGAGKQAFIQSFFQAKRNESMSNEEQWVQDEGSDFEPDAVANAPTVSFMCLFDEKEISPDCQDNTTLSACSITDNNLPSTWSNSTFLGPRFHRWL